MEWKTLGPWKEGMDEIKTIYKERLKFGEDYSDRSTTQLTKYNRVDLNPWLQYTTESDILMVI